MNITIDTKKIPMQDYLEFIPPSTIRLKGHRIGLEHIVERFVEGYSPEQISEDFPGVSLTQIYAVITFYLHQKTFVEQYMAKIEQQAEAAYQAWLTNPSPVSLRMRQLKAKRQAELEK